MILSISKDSCNCMYSVFKWAGHDKWWERGVRQSNLTFTFVL